MAIEDPKERWSAKVATVRHRCHSRRRRHTWQRYLGGRWGYAPHFSALTARRPYRPVVAMEVHDTAPNDWPAVLTDALSDVINDPAEWAAKCVREFGADLICLRLTGTHPDAGDHSPADAVAIVKAILQAVDVPLIIWGCDVDEKDNQVLPKCSEATAGERCLIGTVKEDNYKTLTASCLADGHNLITQSPLDINIAKQVNIMVSEMGFPIERMVMFPTTGGLGYGIEYAYSIQERGRLAALSGDKMMSPPVICTIGEEAWRAKEARVTTEEAPQWGPAEVRGPMWETMTATVLLQAGGDILVMRHPKAVSMMKKTIDSLMKSGS